MRDETASVKGNGGIQVTKEQIVVMKPGRDLDIVIALEVMGYIWLKHLLQFSAELAVKWLGTPADIEQSGGVYTVLKDGDAVSLKLRENFAEAVPTFSTSIAVANQVINHMNTVGYSYTLEKKVEQNVPLYYASFQKADLPCGGKLTGFSTEAEAIVKAALLTVLCS